MYSQVLDSRQSEGQSHPASQCLSHLIEKIGGCGGSSFQGRNTGPLSLCLRQAGCSPASWGLLKLRPCWWDRQGGLQGGELTLTDAHPGEEFVRGASRAAQGVTSMWECRIGPSGAICCPGAPQLYSLV